MFSDQAPPLISRRLFGSAGWIQYPFNMNSSFSPPPAPATTILLSVSMTLTTHMREIIQYLSFCGSFIPLSMSSKIREQLLRNCGFLYSCVLFQEISNTDLAYRSTIKQKPRCSAEVGHFLQQLLAYFQRSNKTFPYLTSTHNGLETRATESVDSESWDLFWDSHPQTNMPGQICSIWRTLEQREKAKNVLDKSWQQEGQNTQKWWQSIKNNKLQGSKLGHNVYRYSMYFM